MNILKKYWQIILIGLIIRLVIGGVTYHQDSKQQVVATKAYLNGQFNPYGQAKDPEGVVMDKLPMTHFLQIPFHLVGRILVTGKIEDKFMESPQQLFGQLQLMLYLIYMKLPIIFYDLLTGILLTSLVTVNAQKKVLMLWLFNPFVLWTTAAGEIDIYPTFFIALTFFFIIKSKFNLAALSLGFGGALKFTPFLLLPFLLGLTDNLKDKVKLVVISVIPYIVSISPYLPSHEFRVNALLAPQLSKSTYAQIAISGGETIFLMIASLIFIYFVFFSKIRKAQDFLIFSLATLLITLSLTHFHIQWFLWMLPFLILYLVSNWSKIFILPIWGVIVSLILMFFLFDASLQFRLFAPVFPFLKDAIGLYEVLSSDQLMFLRSIAASIFGASSLYLVVKLLKPAV